MKTKMSFLGIVCVVGIYFLACPALAIMYPMSTAELTTESELVFTGKVEDITAQFSPDGKTIFTRVIVGNISVIKGKSVLGKVVIEHEGGEVGNIGLRVSDTASFNKGEMVLLFLKSSQSEHDLRVYRLVGKAQGKYTIGDDGVARKEGFSILGDRGVIDNNIPVDALVEKIRRVK